MLTIGIIGGTGITDLTDATTTAHAETTPYGEVPLQALELGSEENRRRVFFLARHGPRRDIPPHRVNYRANVWALKQVGCQAILSTAAAGSLRADWPPGTLVLVDQFIDFTKRRPLTFFEENLAQPVHVDITYPYCAKLRGRLRATAATLGLDLADGGTYVCAEGPRFETAAEIRMFAQSGGDLVGMTQAPEVALAREAEICYASVAVVTNYAAGIAPTPLTHREVLDVMRDQLPRVRELLLAAAQAYDGEDCPCRHVLDEYRKSGAL